MNEFREQIATSTFTSNIYRPGCELGSVCKYNYINTNNSSLQPISTAWFSGMEPWLSNASTRSTCQGCDAIIYAGEIRIMLHVETVDHHSIQLDDQRGRIGVGCKTEKLQDLCEDHVLLSGDSSDGRRQTSRYAIQVSLVWDPHCGWGADEAGEEVFFLGWFSIGGN